MSIPPPDLRFPANQSAVPDDTLLRALLATTPDVVYFKDRQSRFIAVSASLVTKHGFGSSEDLIGKTDFNFFAEKYARQCYDQEQQIIESAIPKLNVVVKETWADRKETWSLDSKLPLKTAAGTVLGIVGFGKDITKTKEMEIALEKAHREVVDASRMAGMAEVATGVLHSVGNVLNSLNVSTNLSSHLVWRWPKTDRSPEAEGALQGGVGRNQHIIERRLWKLFGVNRLFQLAAEILSRGQFQIES